MDGNSDDCCKRRVGFFRPSLAKSTSFRRRRANWVNVFRRSTVLFSVTVRDRRLVQKLYTRPSYSGDVIILFAAPTTVRKQAVFHIFGPFNFRVTVLLPHPASRFPSFKRIFARYLPTDEHFRTTIRSVVEYLTGTRSLFSPETDISWTSFGAARKTVRPEYETFVFGFVSVQSRCKTGQRAQTGRIVFYDF